MMSKFPGPPGPLQLIIRVTHSANSLTPVLARDSDWNPGRNIKGLSEAGGGVIFYRHPAGP